MDIIWKGIAKWAGEICSINPVSLHACAQTSKESYMSPVEFNQESPISVSKILRIVSSLFIPSMRGVGCGGTPNNIQR